MTAAAQHEDGTIAVGFVQQFHGSVVSREHAVCEVLHVDHGKIGMGFRELLDGGDDALRSRLLFIRNRKRVGIHGRGRDVNTVMMQVVDAGHHEPATQIDDLSTVAGHGLDVGVGADDK
jgi:hypothetical protein